MNRDRLRVLAWQLLILVAVLAAWQYLTGIKAISRTPGLYWIDPFPISRPSAIVERLLFLMSPKVRLTIWQMALSTVQSTVWGFLVGISTGFVAGLVLGRSDGLARIFQPYIVAFNSLPRIALVPLITMIFGFGLLAKIVLAWSIVFFIVFFNTFQGARSVDAELHPLRPLPGRLRATDHDQRGRALRARVDLRVPDPLHLVRPHRSGGRRIHRRRIGRRARLPDHPVPV